MPSVDNRIVQMQFDNKDFESGVKTSLGTLDKLKSALNFKSAGKGIDDLSSMFKKFDMSTVVSAAETVSNKFSALGVIGDQVLRRIGDKVAGLTFKMGNLVKSMSVDQISSGWSKYLDKTASVQTIMNATGLSISEVNSYLDRLMWYSDETSFGFTDMTKALQTMTAAGGDMEKLIPMLMGMGNAVAYAGKGAPEFSRVVYNLNQAYGMGYLGTMDWKSVELAGASSKQLKEMLLKWAKDLGKMGNQDYGLEDFSKALTDKIFDKEVMEAAFGEFAEVTLEAERLVSEGKFNTASAAYEFLMNSYDGVSMKAATAAQEAKTFTEAIEATRDAVSSGWMTTFELLTGDYEEAKALWTWLANELWDVFAGGAEDRNEMLKQWHEGIDGVSGYALAIESLHNVWDGFKDVLYAVKDAFAEVFPPMTAERLIEVTQSIRDATKHFSNIFQYNRKLPAVVKPGAKAMGELADGMRRFTDSGSEIGFIERTTSSIEILQNIAQDLGETLKTIWSIGKEIFGAATDGWDSVFPKITIGNILTTVSGIVSQVKTAFSIFKNSNAFADILYRISSITRNIGETVKTLWPQVKNIFEAVKDVFGGIVSSSMLVRVLDFVVRITERIKELAASGRISEFIINALPKVRNILSGISGAISIIWQAASALWNVVLKPLFDRVAGSGIFSRILDFFSRIGSGISALAEGWKKNGTIENKLQSLVDKIRSFRDTLSGAWETVKIFFSDIGSKFSPVTEKLSGFGDRFSDFFASVKAGGGEALQWIKDFVSGLFESLDFHTILSAIGSIAAAIGEAVVTILSSFFSAFSGSGEGTGLGGFINSIFVGISNLSFAKLFKGLEDFDLVKTFKDVLGIGNITDGIKSIKDFLAGLGKTLDAFEKEVKADSLLKIAEAVGIMAVSLILLAGVDTDRLVPAIAAIGALVAIMVKALNALSSDSGAATNPKKGILGGLFGLFSGATSNVSIGGTMIKFAAAILILAFAVSKLAKLDNIGQGIVGVLALMVTMYGLMSRFAELKVDKNTKKLGRMMLAFSIALLLLKPVIKMFANMDTFSLVQSIGGFAAVLLTIESFMEAMGDVSAKHSFGVAASLMVLAAAMTAMLPMLLVFAKLDLSELIQSIGGLAALFLTIESFMSALSNVGAKHSIGAAASVLLLGVALTTMLPAILVMGKMDLSELIQGIGGLAAVLLAVVSFMEAMSGVGAKHSIGIAAAMVVLSVGMVGFAAAMKIMGSIPIVGIVGGIVALAAVFAIMVGATQMLEGRVHTLLGISAAFTLVGIGALALGAGLDILSTSLPIAAGSIIAAAVILAKGIGRIVAALAESGLVIFAAISHLISGLISAAVDAIIESSSEIVVGVLVLLSSIGQSLVDYLPTLLDILDILLATVMVWLADKIPPLVNMLVGLVLILINSLSLAILNNGVAIGAAIGRLIRTLLVFVVEALGGLLGGLFGLSLDGFDMGSGDLIDDIQKDNRAIRTQMEESGLDLTRGSTRYSQDAHDAADDIRKGKQEVSDALSEPVTPKKRPGTDTGSGGLTGTDYSNLTEEEEEALSDVQKREKAYQEYVDTAKEAEAERVARQKELDRIRKQQEFESGGAGGSKRQQLEATGILPNGNTVGESTTKDAYGSGIDFGELLGSGTIDGYSSIMNGTDVADQLGGFFTDTVDSFGNVATEAGTTFKHNYFESSTPTVDELSGWASNYGLELTEKTEETVTGLESERREIEALGVSYESLPQSMRGAIEAEERERIAREKVAEHTAEQSAAFDEWSQSAEGFYQQTYGIPESMSDGLGIDWRAFFNLDEPIPEDYWPTEFAKMYHQAEEANDPTTWIALGAFVQEGLQNGMLDNMNLPEDAAEKTGFELANMIATSLGIASPSKVTEEQGRYVDEGLALGIKEGAGVVRSPIRYLINSMVSILRSAKDKFYQAGIYAVKGFAQGIQDHVFLAEEAARIMVRAAINAAKEEEDANSPAKEFEKLGVFGGMGYANGLLGMSSTAEDAARSVVMNSLDTVRDTISMLAAAIESDIEMDPTIRPVLDLSQLRAGASQANSLLTRTLSTVPDYARAARAGTEVNGMKATAARVKADQTGNFNSHIRELRADIHELKDAMGEMQMVMDTGAVVGAIQKPMDRALGNNMRFTNRRL